MSENTTVTTNTATFKFSPNQTVEVTRDDRVKIDLDPENALRVLLRSTKPKKK